MFIRNKYYRWYYQIIDKARKRGVPDGYYEKHHIIPRCMGGKNDWWNIVNLTYREHFLVHWLLIKFTEGDVIIKMNFALAQMARCNPKQIREIPSRWFERSKLAARKAPIGRKHTEEAKRKIGLASKGHKYNLGRKHTEETKRKKALIWKGRKHTEESKLKMSFAKKGKKYWLGKKHSEETKQKMRKYKNALGYRHTEEAKSAISLAKHTKEAKLRIGVASCMRYSDGKIVHNSI